LNIFYKKNEVNSSEENEVIICITQYLMNKLLSVSHKEKFS